MANLAKMPGIAAVIGASTGATSSQMAPIADAQTIPMLSTASAGALDMGLTRQLYVFMLGPRSSQVAALIVKAVAAKAPHAERIAVSATDDSYGRDGVTALHNAIATAGGGAHLLPPRFAPPSGSKAASFTSVAKATVSDNPDAVVVWSLSPLAGYIAQALSDA